jgi:hypothetical protein
MDIQQMVKDARASRDVLIGEGLTEEEFETAVAFLETMIDKKKV